MRKSKRKFKWDAWDFDCEGDAYIVAVDECPEKKDVPAYITKADNLHTDCMEDMEVQEGWCKFQVRTDWENGDGKPKGWYAVELASHSKNIRGWFQVWVVRKDEWY